MESNMDGIPRKVAFYIRVSTDDQADKYGPDLQRSALEALLKTKINKNGQPAFIFAGEHYVYQDDISGTVKLQERPGFKKLIEDYLLSPKDRRPFDTVAVFKIDRFARKLRILMNAVEFFEENNIEFLSATESIDTSTPFGKAMLGIMGVLAELERENILQRTYAGREEAINKGKLMGANASYGYEKDKEGHLVIFKPEAEVVERIYGLFTSGGLSPQKIADLLKDEQILSPEASAIAYEKRGGRSRKTNPNYHWRAESVRSILKDEVYIGLRYYDKSKIGKRVPKNEWKLSDYRHEPIIPEPVFTLVQKMLLDYSSRKTVKHIRIFEHRYLLRGLLKCDHCKNFSNAKESKWSWTGVRKYTNKKVDYSYYYQCNRKNRKKYTVICPVIPVPADELEAYVINFIKQLLKDPKATFEYQKKLDSTKLNIAQLRNERKRLDDFRNGIPLMKDNLLELYKRGYIDSNKLQDQMDDVNKKENKYTERINQIDVDLAKESLSKGYEYSLKLFAKKYELALTKAEKNEDDLYDLIHMLINRIIIYARPKTESDSVAGKKKEGQLIPEKIDIQLNLPQHLIQQVLYNKFTVKSDNL